MTIFLLHHCWLQALLFICRNLELKNSGPFWKDFELSMPFVRDMMLDVNRHKNVCLACAGLADAHWTEKLTEKTLEQLAEELPSPAELAEMLDIEDNWEKEDEEDQIEVEFSCPEQLNPPIKAFPLD